MTTGQGKIKPGTVADFADSMAEAMENALRQEYQAVKDTPMPETPDQDRHMLFVAIAQGVVRHLIDNLSALEIAVTTTQDRPLNPAIKSDNGSIEVTQVDNDGNRVNSSGTGTLSIATEGVLYS